MSQIQSLINFISERKTYDEVKDKAILINEKWRESSWTRGLRGKVKAIGVDESRPPAGDNTIVYYEPVGNPLPERGIAKKSSEIAPHQFKSPIPNYLAKQNEEALKRQNSLQQTLFTN